MIDQTGNLAGHEGTFGKIAVLYRLAQGTCCHGFNFFQCTGFNMTFHFHQLTGQRRLQGAHRMSGSLAGDDGGNITCLINQFLVFFRNMAFLCGEENRAALDTLCTQDTGSCQTASIRDTACRNNRNVNRIHNLRQQCHGGGITDMTAGFHAFRNHGIRAHACHALGICHGSHHRNDLDTGCLPFLHVLGGRTCAGGNDLNSFVNDQLCQIIGIGAEQHDVHAKRAVCPGFCNLDFLPYHLCRCGAACNNTQSAGIGNCCGKISVSNPCHSTLKDRVLDVQ